MKNPLADNIHLLTVENWGDVRNKEVLIRLENFYEKSDDSLLASKSRVKIFEIFIHLQIESATETNLIAGFPVELTSNDIELTTQNIRTFILKIKRDANKAACSYKWARVTDNKLPSNAVQAGHEEDGRTALFVCRHEEVDNIPGKYNQAMGCHIGYDGKEWEFRDNKIEVLTVADARTVQWVPRHGGDPLPDNAYPAGSKKDGTPLYLGRCSRHGLQVGKIDEYMYYSYGGKEVKDCLDHQVLVC